MRDFIRILGISEDASWLNPPATDEQIDATAQAIGHPLPAELIEVYEFHNGGHLFDGFWWLSLLVGDTQPFAKVAHFDLDWFIATELSQRSRIMPGPRTLLLASRSHQMILYDMDDIPGRLLFLQVDTENALVPLARSLGVFIDCQVAFAEQGYIVVQPVGPHFGGKPLVWSDTFIDGFIAICLDHGVNPAYHLGADVWLKRPEAVHFAID
jgi:hypothetical protein